MTKQNPAVQSGEERWQLDECLNDNGYFTVRPFNDGNTDKRPIATVYDKGNAHLIEAGPELLSMLRDAVNLANEATNGNHQPNRLAYFIDNAQSVIAKAEGRAS